ncbi:MAG: hypothetical protein ACI4LE_07185 [Faecalibacterium sp.]
MENRNSKNCNQSSNSNQNQSSNRSSNSTASNEHKHPNQYTKGADDEGGKNSSSNSRNCR